MCNYNKIYFVKKTQQQQEEIKFEHEIKIIEDEVYTNFINKSDEILDNLETKTTMIYKIKCMMQRSRR